MCLWCFGIFIFKKKIIGLSSALIIVCFERLLWFKNCVTTPTHDLLLSFYQSFISWMHYMGTTSILCCFRLQVAVPLARFYHLSILISFHLPTCLQYPFTKYEFSFFSTFFPYKSFAQSCMVILMELSIDFTGISLLSW